VKKKILSDFIPGKLETYIYNDESYYNEYRDSLFATTMKIAGWDCIRHYEILANGCIPYFPNIEKCPPLTMALLPKNLIIEGNNLYTLYKHRQGIDEMNEEELNTCNILIDKLLNYTRNHLTNQHVAAYILNTTNNSNISSILYLSGSEFPDYLRCTILAGFKELLGKKCHEYPKIHHIYKSNVMNYKLLYGKGYTYTNLLCPSLRDDELDNTMEQDIKNKKYDLIIYGSMHRGIPYYDMASKLYPANKIIFLCGEDIHFCNYQQICNKGHYVFVRELE
jgi:hypothetical protein